MPHSCRDCTDTDCPKRGSDNMACEDFTSTSEERLAAVVPLEDVALLEQLEDALDALDALEGIREAETEGTISLEELRARLGVVTTPLPEE